MCEGEGCAITELDNAVNDDPLAQSPRIYAPFLVDRLERCDAIEWKGAWRLTEVGQEVLGLLVDVDD